MQVIYFILAFLLFILVFVFTRHYWDRPKDSVDMIKKFDVILKKALSMGEDAKLIELRENFVKAGIRNHNGEKAFMIKQRPGNEFRVMYICNYDSVYEDLKIEHIYPDNTDQNVIVAKFEKEISESLVKRKK